MEQGPVDAGPQTEGDYDSPRGEFSPEPRQRTEVKRTGGFRSESVRRREAAGSSNHSSSQDPARSLSHDSASVGPDPPQYSRVGATAEEAAGEVPYDDDHHMNPSPTRQIRDAEAIPHRMYKFTLYETNTRYWITGGDITDKYFRLLQIHRNSPPGQLVLHEDENVYNRQKMNDMLNAIDQESKTTGSLKMRFSFWGILGFIRFTEAYYMLIITKRRQVAMLGGHFVYQVEGTELIPLTTGSSSSFFSDRNAEEARFLGILNNLDLTKSFYFSYAYDITHSLQRNIIRQREAMNEGLTMALHEYNGMFVWNNHLLKPAVAALKHPYDWCLPIIHGFLDQAALDIFGRQVYVTIIGRRSRFFAGARFLKRGVNDLGYVANDVETEQIVAEKLTTSFHAPGPRLFSNPTYTSFLHYRGSIPLYWIQDNSGVTPKPGIDINLSDPFYQPAALHFDHLFERYGCPIYVLNLVKSREKVPRESKLLYELQECVNYLNQSLPEDSKIKYKAYDMSRAAKTRNGDVIGGLETIAKEILAQTGFFHNGDTDMDESQVQNGIARTNCIDCLDRTNAAQFVIGKHAFALQLKALGVTTKDEVAYDTDAINLFTEMFHDHGDNIAMQYGGSHLVNTMATYRKLSHWQSSSRDMVESFKRYYHNSFLDSQRQEAYNLFLGNYVWAAGQPLLWDLSTDYYLHHSDPRAWLEKSRRNYIYWYRPENLLPRTMPPRLLGPSEQLPAESVSAFDDYWRECYRPNTLSSLQKVYPYRITSTQRYLPERPYGDNKYDFSPFVRRADPHKHQQRDSVDLPGKEKKPARRAVKIVDPQEEQAHRILTSPPPPMNTPAIGLGLSEEKPSILRETVYEALPEQQQQQTKPKEVGFATQVVKPADKAVMHLWTLNQFHTQSLHPHVSDEETAEYAHYISHPLNLPLVITTELPNDANADYVDYVSKAGGSKHFTMAAEGELEPDDAASFAPGIGDTDLQDYWDYLDVNEDCLTVTEQDGGKKRYKAYRQWLRGKSLFKQSKVDPEYRDVGEGASGIGGGI